MSNFVYGYDANNNKIYYDSTSNKITMQQVFEDESVSEKLTFKSLQEELAYIGFDETEITNIMNKIGKVGESSSTPTPVTTTNPTNGETTTNLNGSLVSNSSQSLKNNTEYQKARIATEQAKLSIMSAQNEIQKKQLDMMDYNLLMQGQVFEQLFELNKNIKAQTAAIKNQELSATISNVQNQIDVNPSISIDNSSLELLAQVVGGVPYAFFTKTGEVLETLASGVIDQKATNAKLVEKLDKQIEHFDFVKEGTSELKDSNGNQIKPREVEAKANAEKHIEQESTNKTTFDDIADYVSEALGFVEDGVEKALDTTSGFDLDFNPLQYIDDILMDDFMTHKDDYARNPTPPPPTPTP